MLADVVGSTAISMTVVFSVFLAGLAAGAWVFGRIRARGAGALRLYALMEVAIGISAWLVTYAAHVGGATAAGLLSTPESFGPSLALTMLVSAAMLAVPTVLMGGTLPVLLGAVAEWELPHRKVTELYGWNTLGAALGAASAGLFLIWWIGLLGAVGIAVSLNVTVGCLAFVVAKRGVGGAQLVGQAPVPAHGGGEVERDELDGSWPGDAEVPREGLDGAWLWTLAFTSGALILAYEVLWGRIARFLLGDRTMAISVLLFIFIAALGAASLLAAPIAVRVGAMTKRRVLGTVGACLSLGALIHGVSVMLATATVAGGGIAGLLPGLPAAARRTAIMALLVAPSIGVLGLVFPLLARAARALDRDPSRVIGRLYFVNTIGAVVGAVGAGYVLARGPGTMQGFTSLGLASGFLGAGLIAWSLRSPAAYVTSGVVCVGVLLGAAISPTSLVLLRPDETLITANEDEYGVQVMTLTTRNTIRVRNNRLSLVFDLGDLQTTHAQQMPAHLSMVLAKRTSSVLNVGTGYGITAGTFTLYPQVEDITTIEILPFLIAEQAKFAPHNFRLLDDPRVRLAQGDGRQALVSSDRTYDIINVNVLDPYLPGSSGLYTVDFWREARERLEPGGVFTQLFWGEDLPLLVRGIQEVFPTVLYVPAYGETSHIVVAFRDEAPHDIVPRLERLSPDARRELIKLGKGTLGEGTLGEGTLGEGTPEEMLSGVVRKAFSTIDEIQAVGRSSTGPLHTDRHPVLEYRWSHGAAGISIMDSPLVQY